MENISNRIIEIRKDYNLTQKQLSEQLGVSQAFISRIEANKENMSDKLIKLISLTFGINEEWIRSGKGDKFTYEVEFLKNLKDDISEAEMKRIYSQSMVHEQLAKKYFDLVDVLKPSGATLNNIPFMKHPELVDMINYLQYIYENGNQKEQIRIEVKFEQIFPDYKKIVSDLKNKNDEINTYIME